MVTQFKFMTIKDVTPEVMERMIRVAKKEQAKERYNKLKTKIKLLQWQKKFSTFM